MFSVRSIVHSEEAQDDKASRGQSLGDKGKGEPGYELPEVVGTSDKRVAMETWDHSGVIVVALSEALQMHVTKEVHDFGQNEN